MKINVLKESDLEIDFVIDGIYDSLINAIRRYAIGKVPTFAIEDVEFKKNSSVLFDEIIAHRLGLVPLTTKDFRVRIGYEGPRVKFKLKAKGPGMVYSTQMKSSDPDVVSVYKMPIVYLDENQEIELTATAIMGIGDDHAKFSPGLFTFRGYPKITISKDADPKIADVCPKKVFKVVNGKLKVDENRIIYCDLCKACEDASNGKVKVEGEENKYIVHVESWGQMKVRDILTRATKVLQSDLEKFQKSFK